MFTLLVEGWRFYPQSFSIVNQFHCLEILKRRDVRLLHRDAPLPHDDGLQPKNWTPDQSLLPPAQVRSLAAIPPPDGAPPDAVFRIFFPFDFSPAPRGRTFVFAVTGMGRVPAFMIGGKVSLDRAFADDLTLVTPSDYAKQALVATGAPASRVAVVPHGVDTAIFRPVDAEGRARMRKALGWENHVVFLNVGAQYWWKGAQTLAKAFLAVAPRHPEALLVFKGLDAIYASRDSLAHLGDLLSASERAILGSRMRYIGETLTFAQIAALYGAADMLVAPYMGEGFYLPALEAIACGLPVICTAGGPTDDFLGDEFALRIESRINPALDEKARLVPNLDHLVALMEQSMADSALAARARSLGPAHVAAHYSWAKVTDRLLAVLMSKAPAPAPS